MFVAGFGIRLSPKGKTLGNGLFLITLQIEWRELQNHSTYCTEVTVLCLQRYIAAEIYGGRDIGQCIFLNNHIRI